MAQRRMFAKTIIDSDAFLEMPLSTQALYFHLNMRADDEGFINNPKKIMRMIGASEDDFKVLTAKKFVIPFESGVVVIKHWKLHNYIPKDRFKATVYTEERAMLEEKENGSYTECIQDVYRMDTQGRLSQVNLGEVKVVEVSGNVYTDTDNFSTETVENSKLELMYGELGMGVVLLTETQKESLLELLGLDAFNHYVKKLATFIISKDAIVSNHYQTILKWAKEDGVFNK